MSDRPWAMTLATLGVRRCTGQLTLRAEGKWYGIVLDHGAVVGAASPLPGDSVARIALLSRLISPAQAAELTRRGGAPEREGIDEIEALAGAAGLSLDQTVQLRRTVIAQRAARTFSADGGEFVLDSIIDIPIVTGFEIDIRSVIYLGARMNLPGQRLADQVRRLGARFELRPEAAGELAHFGFTGTEQPVLEALRAGGSLAQLEALYPDPRTAHAVIYALVACSLCTATAPPEVAAPRAPVRRAPTGGPDETGVRRSGSSAPRAAAGTPRPEPGPAIPRTRTPLRTSTSTAPGGAARTPEPPRRAQTASDPPTGDRRPTSRGFPVPRRAPTDRSGPAATGTDPNLVALDPIAQAKEAYRRGLSRLRVENLDDAILDLAHAVELAPNEVDYAATLAWARFCHARDKQTLAQATREALGRAIRKSPSPELARFYLGRVERMLGRDKEALRLFQQVLEEQPRHADAAAEVRAIEARTAQAAARESGVFGRKR